MDTIPMSWGSYSPEFSSDLLMLHSFIPILLLYIWCDGVGISVLRTPVVDHSIQPFNSLHAIFCLMTNSAIQPN